MIDPVHGGHHVFLRQNAEEADPSSWELGIQSEPLVFQGANYHSNALLVFVLSDSYPVPTLPVVHMAQTHCKHARQAVEQDVAVDSGIKNAIFWSNEVH
mgnify:CR=1 FL=1